MVRTCKYKRPCAQSRRPYRTKKGKTCCKRRYPKGASIHTGKKGGKYYIRKGRKVYVSKHKSY